MLMVRGLRGGWGGMGQLSSWGNGILHRAAQCSAVQCSSYFLIAVLYSTVVTTPTAPPSSVYVSCLSVCWS